MYSVYGCSALSRPDLFFKGALEEVRSAFALNAAKRLYFMRSFLLELTWRGADLAKDVLVSLQPMLAHPYKQVRTRCCVFVVVCYCVCGVCVGLCAAWVCV